MSTISLSGSRREEDQTCKANLCCVASLRPEDQRQEDQTFKANLCCIASLRPVTCDLVTKTKTKKYIQKTKFITNQLLHLLRA